MSTVDRALFKSLSPLNGLKPENQVELAAKTQLQQLGAGRYLFKAGDNDSRTIFVLKGQVELRNGDEITNTIKGGTPDANHPLASQNPRKVSVRAKTDIDYIAVDSDLLDIMLTWDQTGAFEVSELQVEEETADDDWMTKMLQTKAFHKIPPANIQAIFMRMEPVNVSKGDVIIKQGEDGDYFYMITEGKCAVTRDTPTNKSGIKLANLEAGDSFGEEALISDAKRNATITMLTDGSLMRLSKEDFKTLLNEPMLNWVDNAQAEQMIADGGKWLDVRLPAEFENQKKVGAINMPLYFLRLKLNELDQDTQYILYCDTGRRSSAGAYIMSERGYNACVLQGGLSG